MTGPEPGPVRLVQVGAGGMGQAWLRTLAGRDDTALVGLVDLDTDLARRAAADSGFDRVPVAASLDELADRAGPELAADAVLNVTVPAAHHAVSTEALLRGLPVLSEKPLAETVAQGLSMAAAAEVSGRLLMVSQSRHYWRHLSAYRRQVGRLGAPAALTCTFSKSVHFPGFRETMDQPLLVDMAIHHVDLARDLLGEEPVAVYCDTHNPGWSWFRGDASAQAVFEFEGGARFVYSGSWCTPGMETSWNGQWRLSAVDGTATWDGDGVPAAELGDGTPVPAEVDADEPEEISASLTEFVGALRTGATPWGEVHSNVLSLAMVEGAVRSAASGRRVWIDDVLEQAHGEAVRTETRAEVRAVLQGWSSARDVVGRGAP